MVNELQQIADRVVKVEAAPKSERGVTSRGGLSLVQSVARRMRLISDARRHLPARKDPSQGFETSAVALSLIHGLLSGGRGWQATESMRGDGPLLKLLGLKRAPSAETVEEVVKYLARERGGVAAVAPVLRRQVSRCLDAMNRARLSISGGFVPVWADGSHLEVEGRRFDSIKKIKGKRGQLCSGAFVGPWLAGVDFAQGREGEETVSRRLLDEMVTATLRPKRLMKRALILLDSLYGDGPTLDQIEGYRESPAYIVGAKNLKRAFDQMNETPEGLWIDTGEAPKRGWSASGVTTMTIQCEQWDRKRRLVCRRWKNEGEMIWNFSAVVTNLSRNDERVEQLMGEWGVCFEEVVWRLYSHKAGMENLWKELLIDMGLHHPPCAQASVNATFYALGALAYNLSLATREFTLQGPARRMRLWRFRQEVIAVASQAVSHGRQVVARLVDARDHLIEQLLAAMGRVARQ